MPWPSFDEASMRRLGALARISGQTFHLAPEVILRAAKDPKSLRMADGILVLADGKVEAAGTHEELVAQPGCYSELFELQAAGYR
jgi:ABC-type multidrug transport system fused ATPase/permease subunit